MRRPVLVMLFKNGFVACFDRNGKQIPRLQGQWRYRKHRVFAAATAATRWEDFRGAAFVATGFARR